MTRLSLVDFRFDFNSRTTFVCDSFYTFTFLDVVVFMFMAHGDDAVVAGNGIALTAVVRLDA